MDMEVQFGLIKLGTQEIGGWGRLMALVYFIMQMATLSKARFIRTKRTGKVPTDTKLDRSMRVTG
jgi:hypothetical protein